ncbi:MAG TPA: TraR/DksA C4-type zinc finger protein [Selenomonadales bacterium]|nr:TraR/DksA C4-type zinc finger protein [Selenomonadales bacterium]
MDASQLRHFKHQLEATKERLVHEISRLEETGMGDTMADSVGELSLRDNHPADLGDVLFERGKDVGLRDNAHGLLEEVETALDRIKAGTYGTCIKCGREIPRARLEALPYATQCIACQRQDEVADPTPRPLEEEALGTPFARTFLDDSRRGSVGYDGEDSLQDALKYGSSDGPQDIMGDHDNYEAMFFNSDENPGLVEASDGIPSEPGQTRSALNEKEIRRGKGR